MRRTASLAAALLLALSALPLRAENAALDLPLGDPARREKTLAPALDVILDARTASALSPAEVAQKLSKARLVFLGESHTSTEFHRVQLQVIRELQRSGRKVLVGLEMYPVAEQPALDLWNGGTLSEQEFVDKSRWYRNWGYHWNYYRDIFLFCRDAKVPLYGVNVPRELVSDVRKKGFEGLTAEQKALLPPKIDSENADHRRLFKAFFEEEDSMHPASMPEAMWDGMFRAQCTWDAAMAWNAVAPLKKLNDPNAVMVVLIGSGHVAYGLGAQRQAATWFDGAAASVIPIPVLDDKDRPAKVRASYADFVWGVAKETDPVYPTLGFSTRDPKDGSEGWPVINVETDSVAQAAGLKVGDLLLSMDGTSLKEKGTMSRLMADKRWSDIATLEVKRGEEKVKLVVKLARRLAEAPKAGDEKK
ncbi:MAG: ChaN family lipoprotein [Holophagales bacterium]|nr:ChaN family lipoprotein [Holophagales bacterium]